MNPQLAVMASIRGGVFTRADARACGYPDPYIDSLLDTGGWRRIRPGTYAERRSLILITNEVVHLRKLSRVLRSGGPNVYASHQSAAALHALPLWGLDLSCVHVTAPAGRSGCVGGVHRHVRDPVGPGIQLWNKLRMSSPARAVAEVAATAPTAAAIVLAGHDANNTICDDDPAGAVLVDDDAMNVAFHRIWIDWQLGKAVTEILRDQQAADLDADHEPVAVEHDILDVADVGRRREAPA